MARPAVFIDRDGTLIEDADYLASPDEIRILPGSISGLKRLHQAGYLLVIVTNQSGVARGLLTEDQLAAIHERLIEQVETLGGTIDAIYYCPHHPEQGVGRYRRQCDCRKPLPGLLYRARDELDIDLSRSYLVGDAWRDVEAALAAGVPPLRVPRPVGREEQPRDDLFVLADVANLAEAAEAILASDAELVQERMRLHQRKAARAAVAQECPKEAPDEDAFDPGAGPAATASAEMVDSPSEFPAPVAGQLATPAAPSSGEPLPPTMAEEPTDRCARCGTDISEEELLSGQARRIRQMLYCPACLEEVDKLGAIHRPPARSAATVPESSADVLKEILRELKRLRRQGQTDGFNFARTIAYITQIVAIGLGAFSFFVSDALRMVLLMLAAILVQLISLTLFVISRD